MNKQAHNYIFEYHDAITSGRIRAGKWIKAIYKILVEGIKNGEWVFDQKKANKAIKFIENYCHHSEGRNDLLKLELWQKAIVSAIFGILDKNTGYRQFREVFLVVARKNGKTLFAAAIMAYMAYIDGEYGAKLYCLAPKLEQADLAYDAFYQIVQQDEELSEISKKRRSDIYIQEFNTTIKKIAFNSKKSDGFNPHFVLNDEMEAWPGDQGLKQYDVMASALGARKQPLILSTSTAGYENDGMIKLPNADYDGVVEGSVTKAIRRYMSRQILIGDGTSGKFKGIFHNPTETKDQVIDPATDLEKTAIDDGTLDDIIYDFGGDEDVEDAAVLILNKRDLKAFAKLRDKQGRKVYTIVNHGNTGTIDGVPYVINSACGAVTDTQTKAIVYCMAYGPLSNYEMAIFSDIDARKSLDYKFKQGQIAYRADIFAGGAVAAHNGFIRVKRPASA